MKETDPAELGLTEEEVLKIIQSLPIITLNIEKHQGQFYAWDADTNEFLGQGTDRTSLIERLTERAKFSCGYKMPENHNELFGD